MKILVINGPNLNMLGIREPNIYGHDTYEDLMRTVTDAALEAGVEIDFFQSNHEGSIVDRIQEAYGDCDGIIINPAAYTHTSVAILDALKAVGIPAVEVHISAVSEREEFRQVSYAGMACIKTYAGFGFDGYVMALHCLIDYNSEKISNSDNKNGKQEHVKNERNIH
ncbi:MAG: type II 3-dehydroquinate dehydratase [Clostridiales bacterium]|nr:type II 3-dehydroquinate dehydratase [Clostridiales bacterium]